MTRSRILVVDDEIIIAREVEARLISMGYEVPALAATGLEAIRMAEQFQPDLILMDVSLKGSMDGVEAAAAIRLRSPVPVIYLTAYADEKTLERAKVTEPSGYIVKPFSERELRANIEMALYRNSMERRLRWVERWFAVSMTKLVDAVVVADSNGHVTYLNSTAAALTGWGATEALGRSVEQVVPIANPRGGIAALLERVTREGITAEPASATRLTCRAGQDLAIDVTACPMRAPAGDVVGAMLIFSLPEPDPIV